MSFDVEHVRWRKTRKKSSDMVKKTTYPNQEKFWVLLETITNYHPCKNCKYLDQQQHKYQEKSKWCLGTW